MTIQLLITDEPPYLHLTLQYYGFPRITSAGFLELLSRNLPNKYVNFNYKAKDIFQIHLGKVSALYNNRFQ